MIMIWDCSRIRLIGIVTALAGINSNILNKIRDAWRIWHKQLGQAIDFYPENVLLPMLKRIFFSEK